MTHSPGCPFAGEPTLEDVLARHISEAERLGTIAAHGLENVLDHLDVADQKTAHAALETLADLATLAWHYASRARIIREVLARDEALRAFILGRLEPEGKVPS